MLHDINLAGCRPALAADVFPEHPEGGPNALPIRKFKARFDASILPGVQSLRLETGGGIRPPADGSFLFTRFNGQHPLLHADVFRPVRICLPFLVAPAAATDVKCPILSI